MVSSTLFMGVLLSVWTGGLFGLPLVIDWVGLILFYWVVALPGRVGLSYALVSGFTLDVLSASPLGHYAMIMIIICMLGQLICLRFRKMDGISQVALVFMVLGLARFVDVWMASFESGSVTLTPPLLTAFCSALMWPVVMRLLRYFRRYHGLTEW